MAKKLSELSEGQRMMVEDGLPIELIKTKEERAEYWKNNPPKRKEHMTDEQAVVPTNTPDLIDKKKLPSKKLLKQIADRADPAFRIRYNELAAEAKALGLSGYKQRESQFKTPEEAEGKIEQISSTIKAFKKGQQEDADRDVKERNVRKTSVRKAAAKSSAKTKTTKSTARRAANGAASSRPGIYGEFRTKEGDKKDTALRVLNEKLGKPVKAVLLLKKVYPEEKNLTLADGRVKLYGGVIKGLVVNAAKYKAPYTITTEGRGEESTITLDKK